ncbi:MAG: hypothetical protein COV45_08615 [Deltaproteobacteria bacterium CG11_big_fil_rev_8_21_14_0_20_47_16]|nr:MAG: hypothetical protein COV45_08615 [Deltaproteobacteria bacterium CG11_big_fil_rev_8_21_14_0_20_47_16]
MGICKPGPSQSLPQEATATYVSVADCEQLEYDVSHKPNATAHDHYLQGICDYYNDNLTRAFTRLNQLWSQGASLSKNLQLKVATALGKTAIALDRSPEEIRSYFQNALNVDQNDADALCYYSLYSVKSYLPSSEFDLNVKQAWTQDKPLASTNICIAAYARLSPTFPSAQQVADASCRLLLQDRYTAAVGWDCLQENALHWDPNEENESTTRLLWEEEAYYSQVLSKNPTDLEAWHALKRIYDATGKMDQLLVVLNTITTLSKDPSDRVNAMIEEAQYAFEFKMYNRAEFIWQQLKPLNDNEYIYGMAMLQLVRDQKSEEAIKLFKVLCTFEPNNVKFRQGLRVAMIANMADLLGSHDYVRLKGAETINVFRNLKDKSLECLKEFPNDRYGLYVLREANWRVAEYDGDAKEMLSPTIFTGLSETAEDELGDLDQVSIGLAYTHLGKILVSADGRKVAFAKAQDYFDKVHNRHATILANGTSLQRYNQIENWLSVGWMYFAQGNDTKAAEVFEAATHDTWQGLVVLPKQRIEAYRGLANAQDSLGRVQNNSGNYAGAISFFNSAILNYEKGEKLEAKAISQPKHTKPSVNPSVVWGNQAVSEQEMMAHLVAAKTQYLFFLDPALRDESLFNKGVCQSWLGFAVKKQKQGDYIAEYNKSVAIFTELLHKYPQQPEFTRFLASNLLSMENLTEGRQKMYDALKWGTAEPVTARATIIAAIERAFDRVLTSGHEIQEMNDVLSYTTEYLQLAIENAKANPVNLQSAIKAAERLSKSPEVYCSGSHVHADAFMRIKTDIETSNQLSPRARDWLLKALKPCLDSVLGEQPRAAVTTASLQAE